MLKLIIIKKFDFQILKMQNNLAELRSYVSIQIQALYHSYSKRIISNIVVTNAFRWMWKLTVKRMSQFRRVSIRGQIRIKNKLQQQFNLSPDVLLLLGIINPFSRAPKAIGNRAIPSQFRRHQQLYFLLGEPLMPLSSFFLVSPMLTVTGFRRV